MLVPDKRPFCLCNHEVVTVELTNSSRLEVLREKGKLLCEVDALHWREPPCESCSITDMVRLELSRFPFAPPNVPVQRQRCPLQPVVRRHCALGAGVQHGWLSPMQRTERIRIPESARQSPRTVALPRPAGPAR